MARIKGQHESSVATTERQHAFLPGYQEKAVVFIWISTEFSCGVNNESSGPKI